MSYGWDFDSKSSSSSGGKVNFTEFPEGVTRIRLLDEAPFSRWTHWMNGVTKTGKGRKINCPGIGCPICEIRKQQKANKMPYTYSVQQAMAINVINRETNRSEIMEQGKLFFNDLRELMIDQKERGKSILDSDLRIRRRGLGQQDTTYRIDIEEEFPLTEDDLKLAEGKINLEDYFKPHSPEDILRLINGEKWEDVFSSGNNDSNEDSTSEEEFELK